MSNIIHPFGKKMVTVTTEFCGRELKLEYGRLAFQAGGAVLVTYGDTVVLGISTAAHKADPHLDYFPLSIDYEEKMYATGKISGSRFVKREGRPSEAAILTARIIDRPIRPLFPKDFKNPLQGIAMVLSVDPELKPDTIAMIAVSAAISLTGAPFEGPVAGVRMGLVDGELVAYPTTTQVKESDLDLTVAGTKDAIMMVEAGANEVDEETMVKALQQAHEAIQPAVAAQKELIEKVGVTPIAYDEVVMDESIVAEVAAFLKGKMGEAVRAPEKLERDEKVGVLRDAMIEELVGDDAEKDAHMYKEAFGAAIKKELRRAILEEGIRPDGRGPEDIRQLSSEVSVLPRTHGSAIFTRGSTQALNVVTLAPLSFSLTVDTMEEDVEHPFMHHYNMPGWTVGEVRRIGSPGRREIGHGALAGRALEPVMPSTEEFPYAVRSVSELMSSNGSTSMASVCSGCMALMDAGVPIKKPVSGIAMGLMTDGDSDAGVILSDIQGAEDFAGDMDFKVAGTADGITALQMDIKVNGLSTATLSKALKQAKEGRAHILKHMLTTLAEPRTEMSPYAPRIETIEVNPEKVGMIIGKGGETINKITDETGAEINIRDGGLVDISAIDKDTIEKAKAWILGLVEEPEVGKTYRGTVVKIMDFGAFVNFMPGQDGLVHISEMHEDRVEKVTDVVSEGDEVRVKLTAIDDKGRMNLSMKDAE